LYVIQCFVSYLTIYSYLRESVFAGSPLRPEIQSKTTGIRAAIPPGHHSPNLYNAPTHSLASCQPRPAITQAIHHIPDIRTRTSDPSTALAPTPHSPLLPRKLNLLLQHNPINATLQRRAHQTRLPFQQPQPVRDDRGRRRGEVREMRV